jgi:sigma-E factor negative regulatory protein RseB
MSRCWALLGALLIGTPAWAQDAGAWLARMGDAVRGLDYHGDLVYVHAGQIETLRLFHAAGPDGERERLVTSSGVPREVIRAHGEVICVGTGAQTSIYAGNGPGAQLLAALPGADAHSMAPNYALALGGAERIAGYDTQLLEIRPRDAFRYGYRLWLERDTGMPLKSVRFGADGRAVEQLMFTRIALRERPADADLTPSLEGEATRSALDLPSAGEGRAPAWRVVDPPAGFVLALQQPAPPPATEHLVYSDGIAHVSVYVEPLTARAPAFSGPASRGATHLYGRVVDGRQITVLGDVPAATVERFAQGVASGGGG